MDVIERVAHDPQGVRHSIRTKPSGTRTLTLGFGGLFLWSLGWVVHAAVHRLGWDVIVERAASSSSRPFSAADAQEVLRTRWRSRVEAELEQDRLPDVIEAGHFPDGPWLGT